MRAFIHEGKPGLDGTRMDDINIQPPKPDEVQMKVVTAGLNHRDLFVLHRHSPEDPPLVPGSDCAGILTACGSSVEGLEPGMEVIVNPGLGWPEESAAPPEGFEILGFPRNGTFAEYVNVPASCIEPKPPHLSWEEAGVLALSALTGYRALMTRARIQPGQTILLPGAGSGAVTMMLLFAKKTGCRVIVTSRSEEKRKKALELGADAALDSDGDWNEQLNGEKVDAAVDTVGAATFQKTLDQVKKGGTLVLFGASAGDEVTFNLREFFYGQYNLLGSTMGSHEEFRQMLSFISKNNIHPVVSSVFPLQRAEEALSYLDQGNQFGKVVLRASEEPS